MSRLGACPACHGPPWSGQGREDFLEGLGMPFKGGIDPVSFHGESVLTPRHGAQGILFYRYLAVTSKARQRP